MLSLLYHPRGCVKATTVFVLLLATLGPLRAMDHPARIFFGDGAHPVASGEAWLIANRWGAYQAVLVGTIREGKFEPRKNIEFPQYREQAFDYKLLLAVSDHTVELPSSLETDTAYGGAGQRPEYLKQFSTVYVSSPLAKEHGGEDWETAFKEIGRVADGDLILPRPSQRTIRFLYPDGKPLAGARLWVSLFGSSANHCGVAVGIPLGEFFTNAEGEIHVVAPNSAIAVSVSYSEELTGGPTGTAFASENDLVVGKEQEITVKRWWTLPEHGYLLRLRRPTDQPIAHARLEGCLFRPPCMSACGPVGAPESDESGVVRFRARDLRELGSITVIDAEGNKRELTDGEMRELLTTYRLKLVGR